MPVEEVDEVALRAQERVGSVLREKYRLDRVLGIGGMAVVYAATHRNQKQFAVKMLHPELSLRRDIRTRFLREGYAANSFKHAGAVAVLDDDVAEDGAAFLVMEMLEGSGVEEMWERFGREMPLTATLAIGYQVLDVLAAAHAKGVIHRDIKPANLFLTDDGTVKVLDFGIARVRDALSSGSSSTGTGVLLGTPAFMAPEQALSKSSEIDGRTDVWAVGATLFTLLSGQLVHDGESASHLLVNAATQRARSLSSLVSGTPLAVAELIDRALAFDKGQRWASAEAMRDAIGGTYAATVGEAISRGPLLGLFQRTNVPLPRAAAHVVVVPPHSGPGAPSAPSAPADLGASVAKQGSALTGASREYATAPTVGMITAQPVSSDTRDVRRRAASRDPSSMLALAAGAIVVAVLATWAVRRNAGEAPARSHADSFSGIAAPDAAQSAAPPASATSLPPIAPAPTTEAPREPIAPAPTPPPTPRDPHRAATPKGTTSSPCALVQTLDKDGEPHFTCPCKTCQ